MRQLTVAMLVRGDVAHDNRVRREAESVAKLGHRVVVLALSAKGMPPDPEGVTYVKLERSQLTWRQQQRKRVNRAAEAYVAAKSGPKPAWFAAGVRYGVHRVWLEALRKGKGLRRLRRYKKLSRRFGFTRTATSRRLGYWRLARPALQELGPDVVHAHDLKTLYAGARYASAAGVPLVYDAHEFEVYSLTVKNRRSRVAAWIFERYGARRAAAVITVSEEIADEIAKLHRIRRPYVVMNTPSALVRGRSLARTLREQLGLGDGEKVAVYVGGVHPARGTTYLVDALPYLPPNYHVAIVGPRRRDLDEAVEERAQEAGVTDRLHLVPPVHGEDVPALLADADVSVLPGLDACRSYELSMPNKLFESVQAGLPLAVSDRWRAASSFVLEHRLGTSFDVLDPASVAAAVVEAAEHMPAGIADEPGLRELQAQYCWEAQERVLAEIYEALG